MALRWSAIALLVSTTVLSSNVGAQSQAVLGRDDATFARELYRRGYADLADTLIATIEKSGNLSPEAGIGVKALHLDLRLDIAKTEPDLYKRKDKIKAILQEKEDFIRQYPTSKEAEETSNTLPDVYRVLGETITGAIQKEKDVNLIAQLQKEGQDFYSKAEEQLQARFDALKEDHADPDLERQYVALLYNLPRTFYYHSLLYPAGEWKKKELLEKAIVGFQQFGLDYSNTLLNYEGLIFMGLADKDLGKPDDAAKDFDDAIALCELWEPDKNGVYLVSPEAGDTVSQAVLQKVLLLTETKNPAGAVATAEKFFKTIPAPDDTRRGLAVRAAMAEAQAAAGDSKGAMETAQKLVDLDPNGPWGAKGRDLQGKFIQGGGSVDPASMLKIAAAAFNKGNSENALQMAHQAIAASKGTDREPSVTVDGYNLIGSVFLQRKWDFEAALAFDTAADRYPNEANAPESVYQSMLAYMRLFGDDKRPWFKKRSDERQKTLATKYPNHPRAQWAQFADGTQLEHEGKFLEAAELYQRVQPGSQSFLEAQFRTGNAYFLHARKLCLDKKEADAAKYVTQAETILKKSRDDLDAASKTTMDLEAQTRLDASAFNSRMSLVQLVLLDCVNRPADVLEVLKNADERFASDADKLSLVWGFRISALEKMGKLDDAVALLDSLVKKDPESKAIGGAAGQVARALDKRANELDAAKKSREAEDMWKRAASYYALSGRTLMKSGTARADEIRVIAERLFSLGLHFNEVPAGQDTFVGWPTNKTRDVSLWTQAAELFEAALKLAPNYRVSVLLGRVHGFLGHFAESSSAYGRLFDTEPIYDADANKFNNALLKAKPELYQAYLEWGVAAYEAGNGKTQDAESLQRAQTVFENLVRVPDPNSKTYWHAKYYQVKTLMALGKYADAGLQMRDVERNNSELGAPAGLQNAFKALKEELSRKLVGNAPPPPAAPPSDPPKNK